MTAPAAWGTRAPALPEGALHLVALVGAERFAFPVSHVEEAIDHPDISWVPVAPTGMLGQLSHRGRLVGAWDAEWAFGLRSAAPRARCAAALVLRDGERRVAMLVDDVLDVAHIAAAEVRPVPGGADRDGLLSGVHVAAGGGSSLAGIVRVEALAAVLWARETDGGAAR